MHQRLVSALLFIQSYFDIFMDSLCPAINKSGVQMSQCELVQETLSLLLSKAATA